MNSLKIIIISSIVLLFTACSYPSMKYNYEFTETNYDELVDNLLQKASNQIFPHLKKDEIMLVSNVAESVTLSSDSKLSFLLTDLLKTKLVSKYSYTIREIELSNKFRLGGEGFKILTRDANSINGKVKKARYAVVSTYTLTKNQLLLFLKLIDIRNGNILAASTFSTNLTLEITNDENTKLKQKMENEQLSNVYQPLVL
ncbi:MAG: FlgO family outer membrane protein [Campylobacterota bacterium]|nr:FlgO family outer membrane protein [Campylobacterota bacterium]